MVPTTSPSMDIQVSSNLERLLFESLERDGAALARLMADFRADGTVSVPAEVLAGLQGEFDCGRLDDEAAAAVIRRVHERTGMLVDPHTAVGIGVAEMLASAGVLSDPTVPVVCLATAHPAKFPDAVEAAVGIRPPLPAHLADLFDRPERVEHVRRGPGRGGGPGPGRAPPHLTPEPFRAGLLSCSGRSERLEQPENGGG